MLQLALGCQKPAQLKEERSKTGRDQLICMDGLLCHGSLANQVQLSEILNLGFYQPQLAQLKQNSQEIFYFVCNKCIKVSALEQIQVIPFRMQKPAGLVSDW